MEHSESLRGGRLSAHLALATVAIYAASVRHWHDVARLDETGFAASAFADRDLANAVARHKTMFFAERSSDRSPINYSAVSTACGLCPQAMVRRRLKRTTPAWSTTGFFWKTPSLSTR